MGSISTNIEEDKGPFTKFPGEGLRPARRFITGHNKDGKGVFIIDDDGDHHRVMVRGKGSDPPPSTAT
jgi:hypothetical protein